MVGIPPRYLALLVAAARAPGFTQPPPKIAAAAPGPAQLPYELAAWIARLEEAEQSGQENYPEATQGRIFYVLDPASQSARQPKLEVKVLSGRLLKNGSLSASSNNFNLEKAFASGAVIGGAVGVVRRGAMRGCNGGTACATSVRPSRRATPHAPWAASGSNTK